MTTRSYRFPDAQTFTAFLPKGALPDGETYQPLPDNVIAMRVIGVLYEGGVFDQAGEMVQPPVALEGWHVNVLGEPGESWAPYEVFPKAPRSVFGEQAMR